jgi:hypothetical protein
MWIKISLILTGTVFFISGCNSLVSQFFGTHKLRTFTAEEVLRQGVGDADYIAITDAWITDDYMVVPPRNKADRAVLIYPVVSASQLAAIDSGKVVEPLAIAWTRNFDLSCDTDQNCVKREGPLRLEGVVRDMNKSKNRAHLLPSDRYRLPELPLYLESGRAPIAWYWNLLMMVGGLALAYFYGMRKIT